MQFTSDIDETGQRTRSSQFAADPLMQSAQTAQQSFPQSALYIVGLPIGNAADITLRALWVLDICDHVACEDTRETRKLLDRYGISTPTISVHEHNERSASQKLIDYLAKGERIALVTDAGTPAVSDPGAKAVQSVREAGFTASVTFPVSQLDTFLQKLARSGARVVIRDEEGLADARNRTTGITERTAGNGQTRTLFDTAQEKQSERRIEPEENEQRSSMRR